MRVITRQGAYDTRVEMTLCEEHDNNDDAPTIRGSVQHGWHDGYCDVCRKVDDSEGDK